MQLSPCEGALRSISQLRKGTWSSSIKVLLEAGADLNLAARLLHRKLLHPRYLSYNLASFEGASRAVCVLQAGATEWCTTHVGTSYTTVIPIMMPHAAANRTGCIA